MEPILRGKTCKQEYAFWTIFLGTLSLTLKYWLCGGDHDKDRKKLL